MKFTVIALLLITKFSFAQSVPDWAFNGDEEKFQNCFKSYFCGKSKITIKDYSSTWKLKEKKEKFFQEVGSRCLIDMPDGYRASFLNGSGNTSFLFNFRYGTHSILNIVGCTPARNFLDMIGGDCEDDRNTGVGTLKDTSKDITEQLSLNSATNCFEETTMRNPYTGGEAQKMNVSRAGFRKDSKTGLCVKLCDQPGQVFIKKLKDGYTEQCSVDMSALNTSKDNYDGLMKQICKLSFQGSTVLTTQLDSPKVISGMTSLKIDGSFQGNFPAEYYESGCQSCGDKHLFKDTSYTDTNDKMNACLKKGCTIGYECPIADCTNAGEKCRPKCGATEIRGDDGECKDDASKVCRHANDVFNYLKKGSYFQRYQNMKIQSCTKAQMTAAVQNEVQEKLVELQPLLSACQSAEGIPAADLAHGSSGGGQQESVVDSLLIRIGYIQLPMDLQNLDCYDGRNGDIPMDANDLKVPPIDAYSATFQSDDD